MPNKIIVVMGPHEGVGKTTLATNIAARYFQTHHQPVILLDTDPMGRGECAQVAGTDSAMSVFQVLEQLATKQTSLMMLRGRIPINRLGLGAMGLMTPGRATEQLTIEQWGFFLQAFSQLYDLVVDIEVSSPFKLVTLDLADVILWNCLPNALSVRSTVQEFEALENQKLGLHKFLVCLNQAGVPNSLPEEAVNQVVGRFRKQVDASLPYENAIPGLLNQGKPVIVESNRSAYYQGVGHLIDKIATF